MSSKFKFGAWLPDQADLDNPGVTEAKNVLPVAGNYLPYAPFKEYGLPGGAPLPLGLPAGAIRAFTPAQSVVYVASALSGGAGKIYVNNGSPWTDVTPIPSWAQSNYASWAQYGANVFVANALDLPQFAVIGGTSPFTQLTGAFGDAPRAGVLGIVGQFLVLGNLLASSQPFAVQWSGINAPFDWPTPNSNQAIAEQSGLQTLDASLGTVVGITQGDQWGLILLTGGVVRMTYQGGGVVFSFDTIYRAPGCLSPDAWCKVGSLIYYLSPAGFFVTDGVSSKSIGYGMVDQYYSSRLNPSQLNAVRCGVDYARRLIYWMLPKNGDGPNPQELLVYNYEEQRWTHVFDSVRAFVNQAQSALLTFGMEAFDETGAKGQFNGSPGVATLISPEMELNPGGKALVSGIKPQIAGNAVPLTVRVLSRNTTDEALTTTSAVSPTKSTGFADILVENRYLRAQIDITGPFTQAMGGEFIAQPSGSF